MTSTSMGDCAAASAEAYGTAFTDHGLMVGSMHMAMSFIITMLTNSARALLLVSTVLIADGVILFTTANEPEWYSFVVDRASSSGVFVLATCTGGVGTEISSVRTKEVKRDTAIGKMVHMANIHILRLRYLPSTS